ncbi:MAG TPA: hypothetical protein VGH87_02225 [Polyangiaceae bacterium]|jgi:hypothetical protein|nr:hypothetical protein [Polyangiaceae bacterium]
MPARAQVGPRSSQKQKMDEAQPHLQKAVELYDENDFANALIEFKRAYEIAQDWRFLFNVAQAAYQVSNYALALDSFQKYLSEGGAQVERKRHVFVDGEIAKLKGRVAQVRITVNVPNAEISVDDEKVGVSPLPGAITVSAGKRKFTATVTGKPLAIKSLEVAGGDTTQISLDVESDDVKAPPPPPPPVETRRKIPWAVWGTTAGLFVVWGATGVIALIFSSDAQSKLNTYGVTSGDIKGSQDAARAFALVSDIALGCTVVAAGVATVMTILAKPEPVEKQASAHFVVSPVGIGVYGSF